MKPDKNTGKNMHRMETGEFITSHVMNLKATCLETEELKGSRNLL
ncbi:hypothetical protein [Methanosarcina mazei]|jgi:hypothetical protein|nr:hypothetical protein [Methanosarcina mazei]